MDDDDRRMDGAEVQTIFWICIAVTLLGSTVTFFILR